MAIVGIKQSQVLGFLGLVVSLIGLAACRETIDLSQLGQSATSVISDSTHGQGLEPATQLLSQTVEVLTFTICFESSNWQRPGEDEHLKFLANLPRYGDAIYEDPLQSLFRKFWDHDAIAFTSYGLSARLEPIYLSGLLDIEREIWACYDGEIPTHINGGMVAELWLINHQVQDVQWTGDRYQVNVTANDRGIQLVQFPRREQQVTPLIEVFTEDHRMIPMATGG